MIWMELGMGDMDGGVGDMGGGGEYGRGWGGGGTGGGGGNMAYFFGMGERFRNGGRVIYPLPKM